MTVFENRLIHLDSIIIVAGAFADAASVTSAPLLHN